MFTVLQNSVMPASLYMDMERGNPASIEEQRAMALAYELSILGLGEHPPVNGMLTDNDHFASPFQEENRLKKSQNMTECVPVPSSEHVAEIVGRQGCKIKALRAKTNTYIKTPVRGDEPVFVVTGRKEDVAMAKREILSAAEHFSQIRASRKNNLNGSMAPGPPANIPGQVTIHVRVPYRVVGLVVGPKGATIKRIQQQTHTYIVTPSRERDPVFEVTGMPESVEVAKKEIEAHIALRTGGLLDAAGSLPDEEAFRLAAAVAGFGSDASDISSFYKSSGLSSMSSGLPSISSLSSLTGGFNSLTSGIGSSLSGGSNSSCGSNGFGMGSDVGLGGSFLDNNLFSRHQDNLFGLQSNNKLSDLTNSYNGNNNSSSGTNSLWSSFERDEGLGESPSFETSLWGDLAKNTSSFGGGLSGSAAAVRRSSSVSGALPLSTSGSNNSDSSTGGDNSPRLSPSLLLDGHMPARRYSSDPLHGLSNGLTGLGLSGQFTSSSGLSSTASTPTDSLGSLSSGSSAISTNSADSMSSTTSGCSSGSGGATESPTNNMSAALHAAIEAAKTKRECFSCSKKGVNAALVPCGHNLFCYDCARGVSEQRSPECPVCRHPVVQAIRIFSS